MYRTYVICKNNMEFSTENVFLVSTPLIVDIKMFHKCIDIPTQSSNYRGTEKFIFFFVYLRNKENFYNSTI